MVTALLWLLGVGYMLTLGYGSDHDSWRVAHAAERIWQSKTYFVSRSSGFPLHEILAAPAVHFGDWYGANAISAIAGLSILLALYRLGDQKELRNPLVCVLAICFPPAFLCASSATNDLVPGVAFTLWAYLALLRRRWWVAALLVGLACGFRPTNAVLIIPVCLFVYASTRSLSLAAKAAVMALVVGALAYSPSLLSAGVFQPYATLGNLWEELVARGPQGQRLLGLIPSLVLVAIIVFRGCRSKWTRSDSMTLPQMLFHASTIGIFVGLFLLLPHEPEYMLPMVPSLILLLDHWAPTAEAWVVTALLLSQHLVQFVYLDLGRGQGFEPAFEVGYTVADVRDRWFKMSTRRAAERCEPEVPTVLIIGSWIWAANPLWIRDHEQEVMRQKHGKLYATKFPLPAAKLEKLHRQGFRIVAWGGPHWRNQAQRIGGQSDTVEIVDDLEIFFGEKIRGEPWSPGLPLIPLPPERQ